MSSLFELAEDLYLDQTTYLQHIPHDEFRSHLVNFYNHKKGGIKGIGSILNSIYTCGKPTFHMSRRSFRRLIAADGKNLKARGRYGISNSDKAYVDTINLLKASNEFAVIDDFKENSFVPILISLVDEKLLLSMGDQLTIKLASNWHQLAIKFHQNLKKTYKNQAIKTNKVKPKVKFKTNQQEPFGKCEIAETIQSLVFDFCSTPGRPNAFREIDSVIERLVEIGFNAGEIESAEPILINSYCWGGNEEVNSKVASKIKAAISSQINTPEEPNKVDLIDLADEVKNINPVPNFITAALGGKYE